jgi:uncharacterized protein
VHVVAGSVVVVTGAGSGIGRATALAFAKRGARLVLGDIDAETVTETAVMATSRYGGEARAVTCDVRVEDDVCGLISEATALGRLDVLVNNAGRGHFGRVEDTSPDVLRELFELNVLGVQRAIQAVVPIMRAQRSGHIVVVGSVNGKQSWPYHGPYAATKFALTGLTRALRMELAGSGVSCSLILPVNVATAFFAAADANDDYRPRPIGRMRTPASVARTIVRAVERDAVEANTVGWMRLAHVMSEAVPRLSDVAGKRWYAGNRPFEPPKS